MKYEIVDNGISFSTNCKLTAILSYKNRVKGAKLIGNAFSIEIFENGKSIAKESK